MNNPRDEILFELAENVVMTKHGLLKRCKLCDRYLILDCFPKSKMNVWLRDDYCRECCERKIG